MSLSDGYVAIKIYCVFNNLINTLSDLNGAMWGQSQYVYAIATVSTILLLLLPRVSEIVSSRTSTTQISNQMFSLDKVKSLKYSFEVPLARTSV